MTGMPQIPLFKVFMPPGAQAMLAPVLESGRLACGPQVAAFEESLAAWLDVAEVVALSDASAALTLALYMAGVRPGDEVIVPAIACAATVMPIANLFARPVWCDVDPATGMPSAEQIAGLISEKTRAILFYHWSGDVADLDATLALARRHDLKVIEDASEAFGAESRQRRLGGSADFTVYSFYATKHINTGEGAALIAADLGDLRRARRLRRFGIEAGAMRLANGDLDPRFDIPVAGFNFSMNEIAATLGRAALPHADQLIERHRANGRYYESHLAAAPGIRRLRRSAHGMSAYWTYSLLAERRDDLVRSLASQGIGAQRLHLRNDGFSCFGSGQSVLPGTAEFDASNISIPCGWWVGEPERERIAQCIMNGW